MGRLGIWLRSAWWRVTGLRRRKAMAARLHEEIEFHLDHLIERNLRAGMLPAEARRAALIEFGGVERHTEWTRDEYRSRPLEDLGRDTRRAVRNLRHMPAFTFAAVLTLALGIGATTVMYSIVDHVVLRPLPYRDADRLVLVREVVHEIRESVPSLAANAAHYIEWRERCALCDDVAALSAGEVTWSGPDESVRLDAVRVTPSLFPLLGAQTLHGRTFREDEGHGGATDVVVLSYGFWAREFGSDPQVVGRTIVLSERARTIVGVLPPKFRLPKRDELGAGTGMPDNPALYVPLEFAQWELRGQGGFDHSVLARLKPSVTVSQAQAHFDVLQADISSRLGMTVSALVAPLHEHVVTGSRSGLLLLFAAVGTVLLLVCVNLASLMMARNASRAREAAVRVALGAGRGRLVRESLTESTVLALAAGVVAIVLARYGLALLLRVAPPELPRLHEVTFDARIALAGVLLSVLTGIVFGVLPALRTGGADPNEALKSGGRSQSGTRHAKRARASLIAAQVALTAVLLVAAGLFLSSFAHVLGVDKGFRPERALALDVVVPASFYGDASQIEQVYARMLERLRRVPGVTHAAAASLLPLEGTTWGDAMALENDPRRSEERPYGNFHRVTPEYFTTLGIPLRDGAWFRDTDRGRDVVVLSEHAASQLFRNGENPIGRRVQLGNRVLADVVGIAANAVATGIEAEPAPIVYLPPWTELGFPPAASIVLRTAPEPRSLIPDVRAALRDVGAGVAVARVRTLEQMVDEATAARRFQLSLLLLFSLTALVTACIGIYGVVAHSLAGRRSEIGVRMALGARRPDIHRLVLREGAGAAALGVLGGIVVAVLLGRFIRALLFGVQPTNVLVLASVAAILGTIATVASYVPARRASGLAATTALREE